MPLNDADLHRTLGARPFKFYPQVESTQDIAFAWLRDGAPVGAVVVADEQISGRGRQGHGWHNPPGVAIALSVILKPPVNAIPQITMLGALAIVDVLQAHGASDVGVKWPNDVKLNGKKVCGILPESEWDGDRLRGVVLGMGINVRVDFADTPLADIAISIEPALNVDIDRAQLVADVLERITQRSTMLGTSTLFKAWRSRLITLGQQVTIGEISGVAESVEEDGALIIRGADDTLHRVVAGDLT